MNDKDLVLQKINAAIALLNDVISPHESILASDDQYDSPELWWAYPVREYLMTAKEVLSE